MNVKRPIRGHFEEDDGTINFLWNDGTYTVVEPKDFQEYYNRYFDGANFYVVGTTLALHATYTRYSDSFYGFILSLDRFEYEEEGLLADEDDFIN